MIVDTMEYISPKLPLRLKRGSSEVSFPSLEHSLTDEAPSALFHCDPQIPQPNHPRQVLME